MIHPVTKARDTDLDMCQEDIISFTQRENWIPQDMFTESISCTKNEAEKELYFFVSKTTQLVTLHTNANYLKQRKCESIVDTNVLQSILRGCTCENDTRCENHKELKQNRAILSVLRITDNLTTNQPFPESLSEPCLYRNYQLTDRSLPDVLDTQSVQCEILELVSALANTEGGSIFLGITNTATPTVVGYSLSEDAMKCTKDCISDILAGRNPGPVPIWGNPQIESTNYWKIFLHNVAGDDSARKLIEIRVEECPGGMFYALPVCLDIRNSGEIYQLDSFSVWKKRFVIGSTDSSKGADSDDYHKHFQSQEAPVQVNPSSLGMQLAQKPNVANPTASPSEFCWWQSDDGVVVNSLQFDHCCSKELADSEMDLLTKFSTFPSTEAITERHANIQHLQDSLKVIFQEHQSHSGVAVFLEKVSNTALPLYASLKDVTPASHVFDLVILKQKLPPLIISIFKHGCAFEKGKKYCLTLGQLLKRDCSKHVGLQKGSTKLFFRCQPYFLGTGFASLQDEKYYPRDYTHPCYHTLETVRYVLARILLDCQPYITDRCGNIMVKHLSSYQAKILLGRTSKVMIVASKAGSGKTVLAMEMARRIKEQHGTGRKVAFFCQSRGLAAYVKALTRRMNIFEKIQAWNGQSIAESSTNSFNQYTDVIIDDAHAIPVHGEPHTWQMYNLLFASLENRKAHAYIFLDPDMQDYRGCIPEQFVRQLRTLAEHYVTEYGVTIERLDNILRNSRRICQFTKACMNTSNKDELCTVRQIPEDGVFFHNIQGSGVNQDEEVTMISQLQSILKTPSRYSRKDITILTDNEKDKAWVKELLKHKYATSDATQFPVKSIIVDTLENFEGLESPVILFIIPRSWGTGYIGSLKYRLCVVTRAISRLEFLLPWDPSDRQQDLAELKRAFSLEVSSSPRYMYTIMHTNWHFIRLRNSGQCISLLNFIKVMVPQSMTSLSL